MEVAELGSYLFVACVFATLLQHPASVVRELVSSGLARRALMGLAMGATAIAIVTSPWGKRSGGHFNPAITFTFYRLGKVEFWDTWFYVIAQFLGAISGVALAKYGLRGALAHDAVRYAVTVPGIYGSTVAFVAELTISFFLMITVLFATNQKRLEPYTAYFCGHTDRDLLRIRSTVVRHEYEPGTNLRLSSSRQLLARAVDLFHRSVAGHAGRRRAVSSSARGRRSLLRQTAPRQPQTLHLSSHPTRSLERRILCKHFKLTTLLPIAA
jgi:Major intrinsic protein